MRMPAQAVKPRTAKLMSFPAPVDGWIKNVNLATPSGRKADGTKVVGAAMLENWIPTATGIRMRGGSQTYATVGGGARPITAAFTYIAGNNQKLFTATANAIYDITSVTSSQDLSLVDDLGNSIVNENNLVLTIDSAPAVVSALNGGDWSVVQFATPGGTFLRAVNGADTPLVYDGTNWTTTPAITGVDPTTLSNTWTYKQRVFFIQKDSLNAYYLPVDTIDGAAVQFPMGGVFPRGGSLLFGAAWSTSTGSGLSEQCVFITTEGEVAVYQGTDPSVAASWQRVGVYRIGKPLGPKAFFKAGGDLAISTNIGLIPLSQAIQRDIAALAPSAVSYPIETAWNDAVAARSNSPWACEVWPTKQMALIALPTQADGSTLMFVANARTGAWGSITGWDGTCLVLFQDRFFFGTRAGTVVECEVTGADQGVPYTATSVPLFDPLKSPASLKTTLLGRTVLRSPFPVAAKLSLQKEFVVSLPTAPDDIGSVVSGAWGTGIWGTSVWGTQSTKTTFEDWKSVGGSGYALSIATQITSGGISPPDIEIVQTDLTYDVADIVS